MKMMFPRPRKHSYNTACYFIHCVYGDEGVEVDVVNYTLYHFYKNGELIAFFDEMSGDLWTTAK